MKRVYYFDNDDVKEARLEEGEWISTPLTGKTIPHSAYLISYYKTYSKSYEKIEFEKLDLLEDSKNSVVDSTDSYVLFSVLDPDDFALFDELYHILYDHANVSLVLGGSLLYILETQDIIDYYDKDIYILVGKGEEFLISLLDDNLPPALYSDSNFDKIKNYKLLPKFLSEDRLISLTFRDIRCSWNRCKFCHHNIGSRREIINNIQMFENIEYYYFHGVRNFIFYDNETLPDVMSKVLDKLWIAGIRDIKIEIFGLRLEHLDKVERLMEGLSRLKEGRVTFGLEFLDQDLLNIYDKGISLDEAMDIIGLSSKYKNVKVMTYLLIGAPKMGNVALSKLRKFIESYDNIIYDFRGSFFRLSELTRVYEEPDLFEIKILNKRYTLNDFFVNYGGKLPEIKTKYIDFLMKDPDTGLWMTRKEALIKHLKFFPADCSLIEYGKSDT